MTRLGTTVKSESQKGLLHYATMAREASTIRIRPILYLHYAKGLVCPVSASEYGRLLQCFLFPAEIVVTALVRSSSASTILFLLCWDDI